MSFTNGQLAQKISNLIEYWSSFNEEYSNWLGGTVSGGPGSDGKYPLTNWAGDETLIDSPAKLADNVSGYVGLASASETAAAASAAAAATSESNAATSASTATTQAGLADADRVAAELAESNAASSATTANAQANLATDRAGYAAEWANANEDVLVSAAAGGDQVDDYSAKHWAIHTAADAASTAADAAAAAASAAAAATFDPALFAALADNETVAGQYTFSHASGILIGAAPLTAALIGQWNTAYGWGDHASGGYAPLASPSFTGNVTIGGSLDVTGNIAVTGTVDGVDIASQNALYGQDVTYLQDGVDRWQSQHSATVTAGTWYTIAKNPSGMDLTADPSGQSGDSRNAARFRIYNTDSGQHSFIEFMVSVNYGRRPCITILNRSGYGSDSSGVRAIRIVRSSPYNGVAIQIEADQAGTLHYVMQKTGAAGFIAQDFVAETPHANWSVEVCDMDAYTDLGFAVSVGDVTGADSSQTINTAVTNGGLHASPVLFVQGDANDPTVSGANVSALSGNFLHIDGKEVIDANDSWIRLNQHNEFTSGVYTPYNIRSDGRIYIGSVAYFQEQASNEMRMTNSYGYIEFGPKNGSWCHVYTDRASFYFNKKITVVGDVVPSADSTYDLGSSSAYYALGYIDDLNIQSTGDIKKTSHGNYLYHQSTAYDNDQNGGITFSTSAPSGGTTGDIWFEYT